MAVMNTPRPLSLLRMCPLLLAAAAALTAGSDARAERVEGTVQPSKEVVLNAPVAAVLGTINVREGDRVEADEPLAMMDDGLQRVAVRSAQLEAESDTAIANAKLVLEDAQIQLDRIRESEDKGAASEWEVRRAALQVEVETAKLKQANEQQELAKVNLELERERLKRYGVLAPFAGRVLRVEAEAGASLTQQDPILSLVALDPLEAEFHLPATTYGVLRTGEQYGLSLANGDGPPIAARLINVDPVIDPASQTFRAVFEIDNADESMPAGFPVFLNLPDAPSDGG